MTRSPRPDDFRNVADADSVIEFREFLARKARDARTGAAPTRERAGLTLMGTTATFARPFAAVGLGSRRVAGRGSGSIRSSSGWFGRRCSSVG